jgi:hypothetical protein
MFLRYVRTHLPRLQGVTEDHDMNLHSREDPAYNYSTHRPCSEDENRVVTGLKQYRPI